MTGTELIPLVETRPAIIASHGGYVYVSVHDQQHLAQRRMWKQRLAIAHPDHGGTSHAFRVLQKKYERWLQRELAWYDMYQLEPPLPISLKVQRLIPYKMLSQSQVCPICQQTFEARVYGKYYVVKYCSRVCKLTAVALHRRAN